MAHTSRLQRQSDVEHHMYKGAPYRDEEQANFLSRLLFAWVWRVLQAGRTTTLQQDHLPQIVQQDRADEVYPLFQAAWQGRRPPTFLGRVTKSLTSRCPRSQRAAHVAVAHVFAHAAFWKPVWIAAAIGQIFAIRSLVTFVQKPAATLSKPAYIPVVLAMALCSVVMSISQHHLFFKSMRAGMRARAALSSAIYRKVLRLSPAALATTSDGHISTLLLNDTQRVLDSFSYFHFCWFGFLELILVSALLCVDLGVSALFGLLFLALLVPIQISFSLWVARTRKCVAKEADVRVHVMNELLSSIRLVKLSAWEARFEKLVAQYRAREATHLRKGAVLRAINTAIFFSAPVFVALCTFTAYTMIFGNKLTPAIAFASVGFFSILTRTLTMMPPGWLSVSEASTAYARLDNFFALPELPDTHPADRFDLPENATAVPEASTTTEPASASASASAAAVAPARDALAVSRRASTDMASADQRKVERTGVVEGTSLANIGTSAAKRTTTATADDGSVKLDVHLRVCTEGAHFAWPVSKSDGDETPPSQSHEDLDETHTVVSDVSFSIHDGELLAVVGHVGCGKTSLLQGLLGEIERVAGTSVTNGSIAYCAQQPWIINGSLRQNITMFGDSSSPDAEIWYARVLDACCLTTDIGALPAGDMTEIGERGINLSGGQKARVALARAIYADRDVYLLDDPLSAVDSIVGGKMRERVFGPQGLLAKKAQIVVTHHTQLLPLASRVIVMKQGRIEHEGTYQELREQGVKFSADDSEDSDTFSVRSSERSASQDCEWSDETAGQGTSSERSPKARGIATTDNMREMQNSDKDAASESHMRDAEQPQLADDSSRANSHKLATKLESAKIEGKSDFLKSQDCANEMDVVRGELIEQEDRRVGRVNWGVYWEYIRAAGGIGALLLVVFSYCIAQAARMVADWWLAEWSNNSYGWITGSSTDMLKAGTKTYALIFFGLAMGTGFLSVLRAALFADRSVVASMRLHDMLLYRILHAKLTFFDTNPIGRIINRFSKDVDQTDSLLPATSQEFSRIAFLSLGAVITMSWIIPWLLLPLVPITALFIFFQVIYTMSSRELKRMDGISRSPVCAQLTETIVGLQTVRAYKSEKSFAFEFDSFVDANHRVYHIFMAAGRWLGMRLDLLTAAVVFFTSLIVLLVSDRLSAGLAGLALTQSILMTGLLQWGVRQAAETENLFTGVERIHTMATKTPEERAYIIESNRPPKVWPGEGKISFSNVALRYRPELELVLHNLSFETAAKERIGIVGRTGSGKSSLFAALFRLVELSGGTIAIDGLDISAIGLHDLRTRLAIVPQDPVLFKGTIRDNLDPIGEHSDAELWDALGRVNMREVVQNQMQNGSSDDLGTFNAGLDMMVSEKGGNFSAGERQLLSLGRAILSGVRVVVLDEASASLDNHTDMLIQKTVREQLADRTVLTIAHRLATVADSDRILVMDDGEAVEFDTPKNLLACNGHFSRLVDETGPVESTILKTMIVESSSPKQSNE